MKDLRCNQNLAWPALLNAISEMAEMRRTYAAIEKSFADPGPRSIVISSAAASEGKTLTASGLATLVARHGDKRVLAVDLNWHRPALHSVFGLEQTFSVDDLQDGAGIGDLAQKSKTEHLDVLVAPLQDKRSVEAGVQLNLLAERIIQQAHETYDISIIDTSAMYPTNRYMVDPAVFSNKADGVVLVVRAHTTPRKNVKMALMALETSGANVLGVVVNECEKVHEGYR
jgi:protein-tyrosine kinase